MPSLLIRDVDDTLHARLQEAAVAHHRSIEDEARELLRSAVIAPSAPPGPNIVDLARQFFGPEHGVVLDIPPRGNAPAKLPPDFSATEFDR